MTTKQVIEAIEQMKSHLTMLIETSRFEPISARVVLVTLGYTEDEAQIVLENIADGGFSYCLDRWIKCSNGDPDNPAQVYPSYDVCYWSPDQLLSRLKSLHW